MLSSKRALLVAFVSGSAGFAVFSCGGSGDDTFTADMSEGGAAGAETGGVGNTGNVANGGTGAVSPSSGGAGGAPVTTNGGSDEGGMGGAGGAPVQCFDVDGDGQTGCDGDCDDDDITSYLGNPMGDICGDDRDNDCDGDADLPAVCDPNTTGGNIGTYVSFLIGNDANPGTQASPVQTIAQGMANAATLANGQPVFVAEGTYDESIAMVEGISLLGGYQCDDPCTWDRDPALYDSAITPDHNGITAGDTITAVTRIDGFRIMGELMASDGLTSAITVIEGTPTIENNLIVGGTASGSGGDTTGIRVTGIANDAAGVQILNNYIQAGDSTNDQSACIRLDDQGAAPTAIIRGNTLKGGAGKWTRALNAWASGAGTVIQDNDVFAGIAVGGGTSFGIFLSSDLNTGGALVDANRVNHDPFQVGYCPTVGSTSWCGGIEIEGGNMTLTNNVVFGIQSPRSIGILYASGEQSLGEIVINANTVNGGGQFSSLGTSLSAAIACRPDQGNNAIEGRIRNNILDAGRAKNRFAFYEQENSGNTARTCVPELYDNNDLYFTTLINATDNAHRQWTGAVAQFLATVTDVNNQAYADNNFTAACALDSTFHLAAGSACANAGVATEAPAQDFEGDDRPIGSDIDVGADEVE
jgi:hypothetical protein